ncbi:MAG: DUF4149 domain-containing protein [Proteobacteria bacterium]|nr:DUF4149 domain-containing protein [Pseudomonadota bacterium]
MIDQGLVSLAWLLLGAWFGGFLLFGVGIAPSIFRVLSAPDAGRVVGPLLELLHVYGLIAGLALGAIAYRLGCDRLRVWLPVALGVACGISEFVVTAGIDRVRPQAFGVGATELAQAQFARLHQISMVLFIAVGVGTIALVLLYSIRLRGHRTDALRGRIS